MASSKKRKVPSKRGAVRPSASASSKASARRTFPVVLEQDEDGWFIATAPTLRGCHTQASSRKEALVRIREAIALCLEDEEDEPSSTFVSIETVDVALRA